MANLLKNQRTISIVILSFLLLLLIAWYFGFHQSLSSSYSKAKTSERNLKNKNRSYKKMQSEILNIQSEWDVLNEEFETVITRIPDKSSFDSVSKTVYNKIKDHGLVIVSYTPSNISIDSKTILIPDTGDELIIEKIPIDIQIKGSFVNFGKLLESLSKSDYRLTASNISVEHQGTGTRQRISFITYVYTQTKIKNKIERPVAKTKAPIPKKKTKPTLKPKISVFIEDSLQAGKTINRPEDAPEDVPDWMFEPITESSSLAAQETVEKSETIEIEKSNETLTQKKDSEPSARNDNVFYNVEVIDSKICKKVKNNQPIGPGRKFSTGIGRVYCHSLLNNNTGKYNDIYHIWYMNGELKAKVRIRVRDGEEIPAVSHREVKPSDTGLWKVEITDNDKKILDTIVFEVV